MLTHDHGPDYTAGASERSGRASNAPSEPMAWESWALHVEELTGFRAPAWTDEGYDAWEQGRTAQDFAASWLLSQATTSGTEATPFSDPDDPSSPLLCALALLALALVVLAGVTLDLWWRP